MYPEGSMIAALILQAAEMAKLHTEPAYVEYFFLDV